MTGWRRNLNGNPVTRAVGGWGWVGGRSQITGLSWDSERSGDFILMKWEAPEGF